MQSTSAPVASDSRARLRPRTVLVTSADRSFRQRLSDILTGLRWQVRESEGGAEAWSEAESATPEALIVDSWLPDLDLDEFLGDFRQRFPEVDLVSASGSSAAESPRGPYRQELLYALRRSQDTDSAVWNVAPVLTMKAPAATPVLPAPLLAPVEAVAHAGAALRAADTHTHMPMAHAPNTHASRAHVQRSPDVRAGESRSHESSAQEPGTHESSHVEWSMAGRTTCESLAAASPGAESWLHDLTHEMSREMPREIVTPAVPARRDGPSTERLPELVGTAPAMIEVSRRIRLVAPRSTPVLIEGPTGSGKEIVAEALHRLSLRSRKPFVAINCAAIPEPLLEAELFGHTRGAFTGAVQGRTGRIEAADGGTLFLDEIGEMPLALQSKLLRFVECGELQRVGDNETVKVDVRIVAATHRPLTQQAHEGGFRADLYYRLAVFLIRTPPLMDHPDDLPLLVDHFLERMGRKMPVKRISPDAMEKLASHHWPGNVRELEHVLERAAILAGDETTITGAEIDFGAVVN